MALDLIKFLYITKKFDIFSFIDRLIDKIDLYEEVAYQAIRSIQIYTDEKHHDRFSLRVEVLGKCFSSQLEKFAERRADKPFPRIRLKDEMIIFIPAKINKERFMICDLKRSDSAWGSVLKVRDESFSSMYKLIKFIKSELKEFGITSVTKLNESYIISFMSQEKANEARKKLNARRIIVTNSDLCLAATVDSEIEDSTVKVQRAAELRKDLNAKRQEEESETKKLKKEVQRLRLELEELKEEVKKMKYVNNKRNETDLRAVSAGEETNDIRVTKTFSTPVNNYMAFMPVQPAASNGLWGYMYASEGMTPCKKVKYD
ncbi:hypothetical protein ACKWTF_007613 [Chironomus riparius]